MATVWFSLFLQSDDEFVTGKNIQEIQFVTGNNSGNNSVCHRKFSLSQEIQFVTGKNIHHIIILAIVVTFSLFLQSDDEFHAARHHLDAAVAEFGEVLERATRDLRHTKTGGRVHQLAPVQQAPPYGGPRLPQVGPRARLNSVALLTNCLVRNFKN